MMIVFTFLWVTITGVFAATNFTPPSQESEENLNAATVLYQKNITKVAPAETPFYQGISRKTAALLVKRFASNVLWKKEIRNPSECTYTDIWSLAQADQADIISSCTLGIFKSAKSFNPSNEFSRGQLVIVIARLISGDPKMELTDSYDYLLHLGIVKVDDRNESSKQALRKDLYIMLSRIIVNISQVTAFSQFTDMTVGNINWTGKQNATSEVNQTKVLKIIAYEKDPMFENYIAKRLGSAVLIQNNKIITNAHVVLNENNQLAEGFEICKTTASSTNPICFTTATVDYYDEDRDLAILTLASTTWLPSPVSLSSVGAKNGEEIFVRGYPGIWWTSITLTKGIISGIEKEKYKSDVKIDHGNSGWGAFNKRGELIGIPNSALEDTDTMSYIIPSSIIQEFLQKKGETTTPTKPQNDAPFISYIQATQAQINSTKINTPFFTIPSIGSFSFDSYNFDADRNLYIASLYSQDATTNLIIGTSTANNATTGNSWPALTTTGDKIDWDEYCKDRDQGTKEYWNADWQYFSCKKINGENRWIITATTSINSGVSLHAAIYNESSSTTQSKQAEEILNKIEIKKNTTPNDFDIYTAWPIILPKFWNLLISYDIDEDGTINLSTTLQNTSTNIENYFTFREISSFSTNYIKKQSLKDVASYSDDFYSSFYSIFLSGTTVKNDHNNVFYLLGYKDKPENVADWENNTRQIEASTFVIYNEKTLSISLNFSYEGEQNTILDKQIIDFINQIEIKGAYPLTDSISALPLITTISMNP